jgi:O-antigen/teichoic acid export membrane protein
VQHSRLAHNISAEASARVLYLATRFFIPPFVLGRIGLEAYGLYGAVFVLVAYFGMSAIGFSNAYIKYVAEFAAKGVTGKANRLLSAGFTAMSVIGAAGFGAFALLWSQIAVWIKVPAPIAADARVFSHVIVGSFFAYLALSVFRDVLTGLQEIAAIQKIWIASFLIETVLIFAMVGGGMGLRGLGYAFAIRTAFDVSAQMWLARRRVKWLRVRFEVPDRASLRMLLGYGGVVQINSMLAIMLGSVERLIATPLLGLGASGSLDLGKRFPTMATSIPSAFASSVLPSAAEIEARASSPDDARIQLRALYLKTTRWMNAISGLLFAFLTFAAAPCTVFWLGHIPEHAITLTILFAIGSQFHVLTGPGTSILKASGRPKMEFHYSLANCAALLVFVPFSYAIAGEWTVIGIAAACSASTAASACWFLARANRELGVKATTLLREALIPGAIPYVAAALCVAPFATWAARGTRLHVAIALALTGSLYAVVTAALQYSTCASADERSYGSAALQVRLFNRASKASASASVSAAFPAFAAASIARPASDTSPNP